MSQGLVLDTAFKSTNTILKPLLHMLFCKPYSPNKLYTHLNEALLIRLLCHTPIKNRDLSVNPRPFPTDLTMKNRKKPTYPCPFYVIGHNTHPMMASSGF